MAEESAEIAFGACEIDDGHGVSLNTLEYQITIQAMHPTKHSGQ